MNACYNKLSYYYFVRFCTEKSVRKLIIPQIITQQPYDSYTLIKSNRYQFLMKQSHPKIKQLYQHQCNTPAGVLRKKAIHIFPQQIPQLNRRQKYTAIIKKLTNQYQKSYQQKSPNQIFHLQRKIKIQIRNHLQLIGFLDNKYKMYKIFKSIHDKNKQKTIQQYNKKGIKLQSINMHIYPKGQVWLPTNQQYLSLLIDKLHSISSGNIKNILDIGCGSGILSFIMAKKFKNAKIISLDNNPNAVQTTALNAQRMNLLNIHAFQFDITKIDNFNNFSKIQKISQQFDYIVLNPPWLIAKPLPKDGPLTTGVYDNQGQMLQKSLQLSSKILKNSHSRIFLIYSDLSKILKIQKKSIQQLLYQNNLIIHSKSQKPFINKLQSKSPLNLYKQQSKIQLYQLGLSSKK